MPEGCHKDAKREPTSAQMNQGLSKRLPCGKISVLCQYGFFFGNLLFIHFIVESVKKNIRLTVQDHMRVWFLMCQNRTAKTLQNKIKTCTETTSKTIWKGVKPLIFCSCHQIWRFCLTSVENENHWNLVRQPVKPKSIQNPCPYDGRKYDAIKPRFNKTRSQFY